MKLLTSLMVVLMAAAMHCMPVPTNFQVDHPLNSFTDTNMLYYVYSSVTPEHSIVGVPPDYFSVGLVLHPEKVPAHNGFFYRVHWNSSQCGSELYRPALGSDGKPTNEQIGSSFGTLGFGGVHNLTAIGYVLTTNEFYLCQWNQAPQFLQLPGMLRQKCQVFVNPTAPLTCSDSAVFDFVFENRQISVFIGGVMVIDSAPLQLDLVDYYIGVSFANDNYAMQQELLEARYFYIEYESITEFDIHTANLNESLEFCGSATLVENTLQMTADELQDGIVTLNQVVYPYKGFVAKFNMTLQCDEDDGDGGEKFAFFLSSNNLPECGLGLASENWPLIYSVFYDYSSRDYFLCTWNNISLLTEANADAEQCVIAARSTKDDKDKKGKDECDEALVFVLYYANQTLFVFHNNIGAAAFPLLLEDQYYYIGFSASSASSTSKQIVSDWRINTNLRSANLVDYLSLPVKFPTLHSTPSNFLAHQLNWSTVDLTNDVKYCGEFSTPVNGSIRLTYNIKDQFGLAMLKYPVAASNGFVTKFTWMQTLCDGENIGAEGFSFFFSDQNTSDCLSSPDYQLHGQGLPRIRALEYTYRPRKILFCDWNGPNYENPCSGEDLKAKILQCDVKYQFVMLYVNDTLTVIVNNLTVLQTPMQFEDQPYYIGFSASSAQRHFSRQLISNWNYYSNLTAIDISDYLPPPLSDDPPMNEPPVDGPTECPPVIVCPPVAPGQTPSSVQCPALPSVSENFVFLGTAQEVFNESFVLPGGSALLYNKRPLSPVGRNAFVTSFTWTPTDCDSVYNGADGWTFFLTKNIPTLEQVQSSPGGGLGIQNVPNTIMAAYSATFNEFWISNWTLPINGDFRWQVAYEIVSGPKYTCGGSYNFTIIYDKPMLQMRLENQVVISASVDLDPSVPYYYGLSGGTGAGYFRQEFTYWSITHPFV